MRRYRQATQASERTQIRTNLAAALDELFDLRERHRQEMIERLEKELQNLRQTTEKRRQSKDRIVQNRLEDLLGTDDDLRW
jgi:molecular chaperone GrpE (heat shock protein)